MDVIRKSCKRKLLQLTKYLPIVNYKITLRLYGFLLYIYGAIVVVVPKHVPIAKLSPLFSYFENPKSAIL
jgi:hypothetical protein